MFGVFRLHYFLLRALFQFQDFIYDIMLHSVVPSLSSSGLWQFLRLSFFVDDLESLKSTSQVFCKMLHYWNVSDILVSVTLGL